LFLTKEPGKSLERMGVAEMSRRSAIRFAVGAFIVVAVTEATNCMGFLESESSWQM
jgi:hypothetical protein